MKRILVIMGFWVLGIPSLMAFTLSSPEFQQNGPIPRAYTCQGANVSPPLSWQDPPEETQSYVLVLSDPDTKKRLGFALIHWVLFDINGKLHSLNTNTMQGKRGMNAKAHVSYDGPCPPAGMGMHHYVFQLYALDVPVLELAQGASLDDVDKVMREHIIDTAQLVGTYEYQ